MSTVWAGIAQSKSAPVTLPGQLLPLLVAPG